MPAGSSPKRERQYEHIKDSYEERGVSKDEAEERAARTVNKERREHGETKSKANVVRTGPAAHVRPAGGGMSAPGLFAGQGVADGSHVRTLAAERLPRRGQRLTGDCMRVAGEGGARSPSGSGDVGGRPVTCVAIRL